MTKKVYRTNLKQVEGIKIVCKKCKASFVVPITAAAPPKQCFSCNRDLPWQDINRVIKGRSLSQFTNDNCYPKRLSGHIRR